MKRLCLLVLAAIMMLGACASSPVLAPSTVPTTAPETTGTVQTEQPTAAPTATAEPTAVATTAPAAGSFSAEDLVFIIDGQRFELKSDISPLLAKLGKGYTVSEAIACVYEGMDKTFTYPGICIYTYPTKEIDYIDTIELTDATYKTPKGVAVGGTLEDIVAAYGDGYYDDNGVIVYTTGGDPADLKSPRLYFSMVDGKIVNIGFYSASNIAE